jgi:NAD+ synthase
MLAGYGDDKIAARGFAPSDVALVRAKVESTHWKRHLPTTAMLSSTAINEFYLRPVDF